VTEKRPWRDGETSPWAGEENFPTIFEAARMYPGRALAHGASGAILGLPVAGFLAWGLFKMWDAALPVPHPTPPVIMMPLWVAAFLGLWCEGMYQDVRGWITITSGD
jgi:hypothetical protein